MSGVSDDSKELQAEHYKWEIVCSLRFQFFIWIAKVSLTLWEQEPIVQSVLGKYREEKGEKKRIAQSVFPQGAKYMALALLLECLYLPFQWAAPSKNVSFSCYHLEKLNKTNTTNILETSSIWKSKLQNSSKWPFIKLNYYNLDFF